MADEEQYDIDIDSDEEEEEEEEEEESDDDTDFFPIDDPIVHPSQSSETTTATPPVSKAARTTGELSWPKYSTGLGASNNYPSENNFEYVGECFVGIEQE